MPLNLNRKLTNVELAERYFSLCMEVKNLYIKWLMTESDLVWGEYTLKKRQSEELRLTLMTRNVEAA